MDRDLAIFYGVETKSLNQAVKRNMERFPAYYRFQLTKGETEEVVTKCDHLSVLKYSPCRAYAFTERGVAMLSAVLHSPKAVEVKEFKKSHDRFLILDNQVYLIGASLKDLGKKWFAVSLMSETDPDTLLSRL